MRKSRSNWNNRFHVADSKANQVSSHYYREYFDKPMRVKQARLLKPLRQDEIPLKEDIFTQTVSASSLKKNKSKPRLERNRASYEWDRYFTIKPSKGNHDTYGDRREYFGYEPSIFGQSSIQEKKMAKAMRFTSISPKMKQGLTKKRRSKSNCASPMNFGASNGFSKSGTKLNSPRRTLNLEKKWAHYTDKISEYNKVRKNPNHRRYFN